MTRRLLPCILVIATLPLVGIGCRNIPLLNTNGTNSNMNSVVTNTVVTNTTVTPINVPLETNSPQPIRPTQEDELQRLASSFTERYGSFSNQTDYANLESLYFFMTDSFKSTTSTFVAAERKKNRDTSVYYGLTTRATHVTTQAFVEQGGYAAFMVATSRREAIGSTSNIRSYQQNILIEFRKTNGSWKVNGATWQP